jgi:hypothetical protein
VQFELLEPARASILAWLERRGGALDDYVFPNRVDVADHLSTRQYAHLVEEWVTGLGLRREDYDTHSLRRTKASIIYKATGGDNGREFWAESVRRGQPRLTPTSGFCRCVPESSHSGCGQERSLADCPLCARSGHKRNVPKGSEMTACIGLEVGAIWRSNP